MKCEGFAQITDLMDYLDNNRLISHYCGFAMHKDGKTTDNGHTRQK